MEMDLNCQIHIKQAVDTYGIKAVMLFIAELCKKEFLNVNRTQEIQEKARRNCIRLKYEAIQIED